MLTQIAATIMAGSVDQSTNRYTDQLKMSMLGQVGLAINRLPRAIRRGGVTGTPCDMCCMKLPACEVSHIQYTLHIIHYTVLKNRRRRKHLFTLR